MIWQEFLDKCYKTLKSESRYFEFEVSFDKEHDLTEYLVLGLRRLFADSFGLSPVDKELHYRVVYRNGDSHLDKLAWNESKISKWILYHGVRFVPDILVFKNENVLPVEVKLIKKPGTAQAIATSIGQAIIYSSTYPQAFVFIGIKRSIKWRRYKLRSAITKQDELLYKRLSENNVRLVMREVN
jgi:hypothetical protein